MAVFFLRRYGNAEKIVLEEKLRRDYGIVLPDFDALLRNIWKKSLAPKKMPIWK